MISRGITQGEFHFYTDETRHALNGVFFRDFLVDLPLRQPLQYAYEYYAKYPALALGYWPPLFHLVEGIFFLVFGLSVWVSRVVVLCFALLGIYFWYRIAESQGPRSRAFFSALIFGSMPYILLYERVTMLEIPGVALCLGAIYFWRRFLEGERARDLWALAGFTAAAFLTTQAAIFLVFFLALDFVAERRFHLLKRRDLWTALVATLAFVVPWYWFVSRMLARSFDRAVAPPSSYLLRPAHILFYLEKLPSQLGLILLCLGVAGAGCALFTAPRRHRFFLLWIVSCYLCFSLIYEQDARHTMIWIPPFVYFALVAVEVLFVRQRLGMVASAGLALFFLISGLGSERPKVSGLEDVARYVLSQPDSDVVYYQGYLNGDFIFFVRKFDPQKSHMVAREKQIFKSGDDFRTSEGAFVLNPLDLRPIPDMPEMVLNFFRTWGIRYAVIENDDLFPRPSAVYRALHSDQFEFLRDFPLQSNLPYFAQAHVSVYRYRGELQHVSNGVDIPMPTIRQNIHSDPRRLAGRPWPK